MEYGLTNETDVYAQARNIMRYEAGLILYRTAVDTTDDCELLGTCTSSSSSSVVSTSSESSVSSTSSSVVTNQWTLEVRVDANTPAARSVPKVGTVVAWKFDFTAWLSDVTLTSVKVSRDGLGSANEVKKVWFEDNGMRVSTQATLNTVDNSILVSFAPAMVIKANSTKVLDLVVSLEWVDAGSQHRFVIGSAADVNSSATESGAFPLFTNFMTTYNYTVANINVASNAGMTGNYKVGDTNVDLGKFTVSNNSNEEKVGLISIRLRSDNSSFSTNVSNIAVYRGATKVSSDVTFDGRYVNIKLADDVKNTDGTAYYSVRGDITNVDTRTQENYQLSLDKPDDLRAIERSTGFQAKVNTVTPLVIGMFSIKGGDVILTRDASLALAQTIPQAALEVSLAKGNVKAAEAFTFDRLPVTFTNGNLSQFTQMRLYINGVAVSAVAGGVDATSVVFEGPFTLNQGNNTIEIKAQTRSNIAVGTYKLFALTADSFVNAETVVNGAKLTSDRYVWGIATSTVTVSSTSLTLSRNDGIANTNLVPGATDVTMMQFTANPGSTMDVVVNGMAFDVLWTIPGSQILGVTLYKDWTAVKTSSVAGGVVRFDNIAQTIAKNTSATYKLVASFWDAISQKQTVQFQLQGANIDAQDTNGSRLTVNSSVTWALYTFTDKGTITVANVSNSDRLLMGANTEYLLGKLQLRATNADSQLKQIFLQNSGSLNLGSVAKSVELVNGSTIIPGTIVNNTVKFEMNNAVVSTANSSDWIIRAVFNWATTEDRAGETVQFKLSIATTNGVADYNSADYAGYATGIVATNANGEYSDVWNVKFETQIHQLERVTPLFGLTATNARQFNVAVTAKGDTNLDLTSLTVKASTNLSNDAATYELRQGSTLLATSTKDANGNVVFNNFRVSVAPNATENLQIAVVGINPTSAAAPNTNMSIVDAAYEYIIDNGTHTLNTIAGFSNLSKVNQNVSGTN